MRRRWCDKGFFGASESFSSQHHSFFLRYNTAFHVTHSKTRIPASIPTDMKTRFLCPGTLLAAALLALCGAGCSKDQKRAGDAPDNAGRQIYEWRIYALTGDGAALDAYLAETLIPAYNRLGVRAGAFQPMQYAGDEPRRRYLMFVYSSIGEYLKVKREIWNDTAYRAAAQPWFDASALKPAYSNFESHLCEAFSNMPRMRDPDKSRGMFELRIYRSPNEEANQRKISMFNDDVEIQIFDDSGINSVCYGETLAGSKMPSLIYLTWYENLEKRTAAWNKFRVDPRWNQLKKDPKYAHTATDNTSQFLLPLPYSQF